MTSCERRRKARRFASADKLRTVSRCRVLMGEKVRLRALERLDLPTVVRWFADPEVRASLARVDVVSLAEEERWFDALLRSTAEVAFAIDAINGVDGVDGVVARFVGTCSLHRIDWRNRSAVIGIVLGDAANRHLGYGSDAVRCLLRHAFDSLGLYRVELEVLVDNAPAIRCYERLGFITEGVRVGARFQHGRFVDLRLMRLLVTEWSSPGHSSPSSAATPTQPRRRRS
jgi:RimJ/RimL family protein N-acetyltransferase